MPASGHSYLRTHRIAGEVLLFDLDAETEAIRGRAATAASGRSATTLVKEGPLRIEAVSLAKGGRLRAHAVAGAVSIQVLRGRVQVDTPNDDHELAAGALVAFAPGVRHDVLALRDATLLITIAT